jgi:hypothetical protein
MGVDQRSEAREGRMLDAAGPRGDAPPSSARTGESGTVGMHLAWRQIGTGAERGNDRAIATASRLHSRANCLQRPTTGLELRQSAK